MTDDKAAVEAFEAHKNDLKTVETVLTDGGYTGESFAKSIDAKVEVAKHSDL